MLIYLAPLKRQEKENNWPKQEMVFNSIKLIVTDPDDLLGV